MSYRVLILSLALAAAAGSALAAVELILQDGRRVRGTEVRREGGDYVVTLDSGDTIALPTQLVESVQLTGEGEAREEPPPLPQEFNEPGVIAGQAPPPGPSGLRQPGPETLAGTAVNPPTTSEQLEVLGPPARFQRDIVGNRWAPSTDWNMDVSQNNFNPSNWAEGPIDPEWQPESAFDPDEDVLAQGRSTWQTNIIDPGWTPSDGFHKQ